MHHRSVFLNRPIYILKIDQTHSNPIKKYALVKCLSLALVGIHASTYQMLVLLTVVLSIDRFSSIYSGFITSIRTIQRCQGSYLFNCNTWIRLQDKGRGAIFYDALNLISLISKALENIPMMLSWFVHSIYLTLLKLSNGSIQGLEWTTGRQQGWHVQAGGRKKKCTSMGSIPSCFCCSIIHFCGSRKRKIPSIFSLSLEEGSNQTLSDFFFFFFGSKWPFQGCKASIHLLTFANHNLLAFIAKDPSFINFN